MTTDDGFFDEGVAARYDDPAEKEFSAPVSERTVDFLAAQAGGGP